MTSYATRLSHTEQDALWAQWTQHRASVDDMPGLAIYQTVYARPSLAAELTAAGYRVGISYEYDGQCYVSARSATSYHEEYLAVPAPGSKVGHTAWMWWIYFYAIAIITKRVLRPES